MSQSEIQGKEQKLPYESPDLQVVSVRIEERLLSCGKRERRRRTRGIRIGRRRRGERLNITPVGKVS